MKKSVTIEYDVAELIREMHTDSKENREQIMKLDSRTFKVEEAIIEIKKTGKNTEEMLLRNTQFIEDYKKQEIVLNNHDKDIETLMKDSAEIKNSIKTSFFWIKGFAGVLIGMGAMFMFAFKSYIKEISIEAQKELVTQNVKSELNKYDIIIKDK